MSHTYYQHFALEPLAPVNFVPELSEEVKKPKWKRVETRAESLLLAALPKALKEEMVAARLTGVLAILTRAMVIYQPGSLAERATALKCLESPGEPTDAKAACITLRKWHRWLLRVRGVGATPPDASILVEALTGVRKNVRNTSLLKELFKSKNPFKYPRSVQHSRLGMFHLY